MAAEKKNSRQEGVAVEHRDLSTPELGVRVQHANTLIAMYVAQRDRNKRIVSDASNDMRTCDKMIAELSGDVSTLNALIRTRRG